jgi:tetratricopeptide (TPR) repeat protein
MFGPSFWAKLSASPAGAALAADPSFRALIEAVAADPAKMNDHLGDPRFQAALQIAFGLSVQAGSGGRGGGGDGEASARPPPPPPREPTPAPAEPTAEEKAAAEAREAAATEKAAGNAAYKAKDFDAAIAAYTRAAELDPTDPTYLTNRAAAKLEAGDAAGAVADCDAAVDAGRAARAPYTAIARALARKGAALARAGRLADAVEAYQKSLTEHRTADTLKKMQAAQKALKAATEAAYVDPGKADEEKEAGNAAFKEGRFPEAVKHYTEALARGPPGTYPDAHKLLSNRAACYTKLGAWADGEKDADACIALAPAFVKGYSRKGHLQFFKKEFDQALTTYRLGLKVDPESEELKDGVSRCIDAIQKVRRDGEGGGAPPFPPHSTRAHTPSSLFASVQPGRRDGGRGEAAPRARDGRPGSAGHPDRPRHAPSAGRLSGRPCGRGAARGAARGDGQDREAGRRGVGARELTRGGGWGESAVSGGLGRTGGRLCNGGRGGRQREGEGRGGKATARIASTLPPPPPGGGRPRPRPTPRPRRRIARGPAWAPRGRPWRAPSRPPRPAPTACARSRMTNCLQRPTALPRGASWARAASAACSAARC